MHPLKVFLSTYGPYGPLQWLLLIWLRETPIPRKAFKQTDAFGQRNDQVAELGTACYAIYSALMQQPCVTVPRCLVSSS